MKIKFSSNFFFCYLDYASRVLENHLEHPGAPSELTRALFFLGCVKKNVRNRKIWHPAPGPGRVRPPQPGRIGIWARKFWTGSTGNILSRPPLGVGGCKFEDNTMKHVAWNLSNGFLKFRFFLGFFFRDENFSKKYFFGKCLEILNFSFFENLEVTFLKICHPKWKIPNFFSDFSRFFFQIFFSPRWK